MDTLYVEYVSVQETPIMSRYRHITQTVKATTGRVLRPVARASTSVAKWAGDRVLPIVIALTLSGAGFGVYASLNSPAPPTDPSSQSYSMQDLCNRLETGAAGTLASTFTEPTTGPSATTSMCSADDVYALTPQPDESAAAASNQVGVDKTIWALNPLGQWGLITGSGITAEGIAGLLAATGQNSCYDVAGTTITCTGTGQDGELQLGATASPRFTNNSDGTITDNLTGLIWLQNANCAATLGGVTKTTTLVWADALTWSNNMASGSCGLTDGSVAGDWRLPNITELESLVDLQNSSPSLPTGHPFTGVVSSRYWSSTTTVNSPTNAWYVLFTTGTTFSFTKTNGYDVWPVR